MIENLWNVFNDCYHEFDVREEVKICQPIKPMSGRPQNG